MSNKFETFGKYVLLEKLATGGMAEVFLARGSGASGIAKFFALKRILPQFSENPEFVDMFKNEAKIAINLKHSNIVSIHEYDEEKGTFYIAMDYVEGRNLRQILNKITKSGLPFSIEQVAFLIKEVAAGLDHAHHCIDGATGKPLNIIHRDMSPQNIMVSFDGEVKIIDFGIAKAEIQIENTRAGTLKGKFHYMSPEQADEQAVDLRSDIFSLGIVLWELLARDRLFVANNAENALRKIRDCQIPSLRKINPNIHSELERITMKALARDRGLRYQTCSAFHRDLNRFLNRQYPDFTAQDFAVLVKSVFAEEIMSLRKRLIAYSKVSPESNRQPAAISLDNTGGGHTQTVQTQTDSLVTESKSGPAPKSTLNESLLSIKTSNVPGPKAIQGPQAGRPPVSSSDQETLVSPDGGFESEAPEPQLSMPEVSSASVSNEASQSRILRRQMEAPKRPSLGLSGLFSSFMILLCAYLISAKFMPSQISPLIAQLDPVLGPVHDVFGIRADSNLASVTSLDRNAHDPMSRLQGRSANGPRDLPLLIVSKPSGADILIDNQSDGVVTPALVQVPTDRPFRLTVRKKGYGEAVRERVTRADFGDRVEVSLVKASIGYLSVDTIPASNSTLYINDLPIPDRLPLRNFEVPAGVELRLRVSDELQNTSEEITITVPEQKKRSVQLQLRRRH